MGINGFGFRMIGRLRQPALVRRGLIVGVRCHFGVPDSDSEASEWNDWRDRLCVASKQTHIGKIGVMPAWVVAETLMLL